MITPGEWNRACDSYGKVRHSRKYDCVYSHLPASGGQGERLVTIAARIENGADANLIAASPKLLKALKVLVDHAQEQYPHFESERGQSDIKAALEAIAEAEGRK